MTGRVETHIKIMHLLHLGHLDNLSSLTPGHARTTHHCVSRYHQKCFLI